MPRKITDGGLIEAADAADHLTGSAMPRILLEVTTHLVGRKIAKVGYVKMDGEAWPALVLDNGQWLLVQKDNEGNGPGVVMMTIGDRPQLLCETKLKPQQP